MILLVWTVRNLNGKESDNYLAFDTLDEAKERYAEIVKRDDTFVASICSIIESTDYDLEGVEK